jgi:glycosyltransferase involved in cell wall biosynthesis
MAKKKLTEETSEQVQPELEVAQETLENKMRVGIYTIALNEEQFVERWYEHAKDADYLLIADTGSKDNTVSVAQNLGINVVSIGIKPWRFDDARNAAVACMPADLDYCLALDMDEILLPGWREELEKAFALGATRPRYKYTWSWKDKEETIPDLEYGGDKIHSRAGYRWKHPVHEVMYRYGDTPETQAWIDLEIHHHPDNTKPRSQYLPLLKQAVDEDPEDDRNAFYYARELYFYNRYEEAAVEFKRHLGLKRSVWAPERAASMRYLSKLEENQREEWLLMAIEQAPGRREPLVELAQHYYVASNWRGCYNFSTKACAIEEKPLDYLCEDFAWRELPWDLAAISAFQLGLANEAIELNEKAMELAPDEKRLKVNHLYYKEALEKSKGEELGN